MRIISRHAFHAVTAPGSEGHVSELMARAFFTGGFRRVSHTTYRCLLLLSCFPAFSAQLLALVISVRRTCGLAHFVTPPCCLIYLLSAPLLQRS